MAIQSRHGMREIHAELVRRCGRCCDSCRAWLSRDGGGVSTSC